MKKIEVNFVIINVGCVVAFLDMFRMSWHIFIMNQLDITLRMVNFFSFRFVAPEAMFRFHFTSSLHFTSLQFFIHFTSSSYEVSDLLTFRRLGVSGVVQWGPPQS